MLLNSALLQRGGDHGAVALITLVTAAAMLALSSCTVQPTTPAPQRVAGDSPARMRLITQEQYVNSLKYVFGPGVEIDARFAPLSRTNGLLENGAAFAGVTNAQVEQYQRTASLTAATVVDQEHRNYLIPCKPQNAKAPDDACAAAFLATVGRYLYRKPVPAESLTKLISDSHAGVEKFKDFYAGLAVALEGMLLSPDVLFITDTTEPDPDHPGRQRLDAYSLASRLSFFLWNAAPDDDILNAAASGEIETAKGLARVVDMMLKSPRLQTGLRAFFDDMLGFDDFDSLAKDVSIYPAFTGSATADAREQTLRTIVHYLVTEDGDYRGLYTTRDTFMSPALGAIYGVPTTPGWTTYEFPQNGGHEGIQTLVGFLALHSHPGRSSPTRRGKAIRELLLCQMVPSPPPNVDFSLVNNPNSNYHTARERLDAHRKNPVCAGCHRITDPIGLALENFDGAGQYRTTERGAPIDASGTLDGANFGNAEGLAQVLHDHPALPTCLTRRLYAYAAGGPVTPEDEKALKPFEAQFAAQGYRVPELLRTIALSAAFSEIRPSPEDEGPRKSTEAPGAKNAATSLR